MSFSFHRELPPKEDPNKVKMVDILIWFVIIVIAAGAS